MIHSKHETQNRIKSAHSPMQLHFLQASMYLKSIKDFSFLLALHVLSKTSSIFMPISAVLQEKGIDLMKCVKHIGILSEVLAKCRINETEFVHIFQKCWGKSCNSEQRTYWS